MNHSLKEMVALVTGGTKGIGKAIADRLSNAGIQVIITARTAPAEVTEGQYFIQSDLAQPESAEIIAAEILEKYGRIDIIVNNAGANLSPGGGFSTLSDEHWNNDWQTNFMSVVRINKALLPVMIDQKSGVIVNISTGAAKLPVWEMTMSYSSAKAALNAYSKALANEVATHGVRVNVVSPGLVETPLMLEFIQNMAQSSSVTQEEAYQSVMEKLNVPLGRMAEPDEVAGIVAYLVSPEAKYITGVNYSVDGGALPTI
ncbi:SDR family oxidoreductase [Chryseobacterium cheonjiense]|uniref:SDR family oxidoreductase n=1 Tax=Chryseobacterium cheonjiense TaxID=2728845 RepID=A0A7Y0A6B2_9FLAO|nr:SDR family oxidoreductase [Chryseobacterium cheonjiense]NML57498.1 SDR family oxidoreductase [Chryseobacterium cheonjiense]